MHLIVPHAFAEEDYLHVEIGVLEGLSSAATDPFDFEEEWAVEAAFDFQVVFDEDVFREKLAELRKEREMQDEAFDNEQTTIFGEDRRRGVVYHRVELYGFPLCPLVEIP